MIWPSTRQNLASICGYDPQAGHAESQRTTTFLAQATVARPDLDWLFYGRFRPLAAFFPDSRISHFDVCFDPTSGRSKSYQSDGNQRRHRPMTASNCLRLLLENVQRQDRSHSHIGRVHQLADTQIHRHTRDEIGLLASKPMVRHHIIDHFQKCVSGC